MRWLRPSAPEPTVHSSTVAQAHPGDDLVWADDASPEARRRILSVEAVLRLRGAADEFDRLRAATGDRARRPLAVVARGGDPRG